MRFEKHPRSIVSKKVVAAGIATALSLLAYTALLGGTLLRRHHVRSVSAQTTSGGFHTREPIHTDCTMYALSC